MAKEKFAGRRLTVDYDVAVIGGGLAGICAAIAAARHGCKTALVHDRPVLGGNSSSEVRVNPGGACNGACWARETGIIEEIMIEDRVRNHDPIRNGMMNSVWDMVLYEWVKKEPNLTLYLNTSARGVTMRGRTKINRVICQQFGSERTIEVGAKFFIDCTGDGTVGAAAGAEFRMGREARDEFGESLAPEKADNQTQGSSLLFRARDVGRPVKFTPPDWAEKYPTEDSLYKRFHRPVNKTEYAGYWWIEVGVPYNTIDQNEEIRDEALRHLLGVWDHIKNYGDHGADNLALDWIGMVPGKRESRRLIGDYILTENDLKQRTLFRDRVAYGGWSIDVHTMGGILARGQPPEPLCGNPDLSDELRVEPYSIPLRSLYSRNISNLFMAGRNLSATHVALGSARLMLTCALMGQAAGTAAALCLKYGTSPRSLVKYRIRKLQQTLLKDDCFVMNMPNRDPNDIARNASVTASSSAQLRLEPSGSAVPLTAPRAQIFPVSANRVETISLHLKNETNEDKQVELEFLPATDVWTLNESPGRAPVSASATVPAGFSGWVEFRIGKRTRKGLYRINLSPCGGVSWSSARPQPGVTCAWKKASWKRWVASRTAQAMRLEPPSLPFEPQNVINGVNRPERWTNIWISDPDKPLPQEIRLDFNDEKTFNSIYLTFDTYLNVEHSHFPPFHRIPECASDYVVRALIDGDWKELVRVEGNYQRRRIHRFEPVKSRCVSVVVSKTNGDPSARIYEIRIYNE